MSFESLPVSREANHFNLLRLIAAGAVVFSHAYTFTLGGEAPDPLQRLVGIDVGTTAVIAFFAISGYFISLSFERRRSNAAFVRSRVTRIWPGLIVVSLICAFVLGPMLTEVPLEDYFRSSAVWLYPVQTVALTSGVWDPLLPGVFAHNPAPGTVNGSLWTLLYEVACYIGLFVAGVLGLLRRGRFRWLLVLWFGGYLVTRYSPLATNVSFFAMFSVPFVIGMIVFHVGSARLKGWIVLLVVVGAASSALAGHFIEELWSAGVALGVLWLGFARAPGLLAFNKIGDFSYGTYIYGFPVGQTIVALAPGIDASRTFVLALPISIFCGAASWFLVERPALERIKRSAQRAERVRKTDGCVQR